MSDDTVFRALYELSFDYRNVINTFLRTHRGWTENTHGYGAPGEAVEETTLGPMHGPQANVSVSFDIWRPMNMNGQNTVFISAFTSQGQQRQEALNGNALAALPDRDARLKHFEDVFLRVTSIIGDP